MKHRIKYAGLGALAGALFGIFFAAFASITHNGPELITGIKETWWWFAALGAFAGAFWRDEG